MIKLFLKQLEISKYGIVLIITLIGCFLLVYSPHINYGYPYHVDEWHHITEASRLQQNYQNYYDYLTQESVRRFSGLEVGFHVFLAGLGRTVDLVLFYKFLPAIWAVLSALALFYVVYKKSRGNFWLSWLAVIFFISIKSDVNITGLWFFTPLSFSIPFIYLFYYFFTEAVSSNNKKFFVIALAIMILLVFVHPLSVLFAIPALILFTALNYKIVWQNKGFYWPFLMLPIVAVLFYKYTLGLEWPRLLPSLWEQLQFKRGWGVLEANNHPGELYSWLGYVLVVCGVIYLIIRRKFRQYLGYFLWLLTILLSIIVYKLTGISFITPYQRNIYYLGLVLPIFSAWGAYELFLLARKKIKNIWLGEIFWPSLAIIIVIVVGFFLIFRDYWRLDEQLALYQVINDGDYQTLEYLKEFPATTVMAPPFFSTALFAVAGHEPVGTTAFYGNKDDVARFFLSDDCQIKKQVLAKNSATLVVSPKPIDCNFKFIKVINGNYIYQIK